MTTGTASLLKNECSRVLTDLNVYTYSIFLKNDPRLFFGIALCSFMRREGREHLNNDTF